MVPGSEDRTRDITVSKSAGERQEQSNLIASLSFVAAVTHRSLLNIFYILTHTHFHRQTDTHMLGQSVSHAPSKCGSFVRLP